jgi:3-hydroxybutyrate dehydrogenase
MLCRLERLPVGKRRPSRWRTGFDAPDLCALTARASAVEWVTSARDSCSRRPGIVLDAPGRRAALDQEVPSMTAAAVLADRTALVTGAGSGIGAAIAEELARTGAYVLVQDLRSEAAMMVAAGIRAAGGAADAVGGDVSNPADVAAIVDGLLRSHARVDVLVNNAGLQHVAPIERYPLDQWNRLLGVLLTGPFLFTQAVLPPMRAQRWGRIINVASINGKRGERGKAAYCAAKHGLIGLTRVAALEAAADGITVNAICPGYVDTPLVRGQLADLAAVNGVAAEEVLERVVLPSIPQRRLLEAAEVAALARYVASDEARGITGQAINVSAGLVMH